MNSNGAVLLRYWPVLTVAGLALIGWGMNTAIDAGQDKRLDDQDKRTRSVERNLREQAEINGKLSEQGEATKKAIENLSNRIDRVLEARRMEHR